jgi:membrane dipeptidase
MARTDRWLSRVSTRYRIVGSARRPDHRCGGRLGSSLRANGSCRLRGMLPIRFIVTLVVVAALSMGCEDRSWQPQANADLRKRAAAIHEQSIVVDSHNDLTSFWLVDYGFELAMDGDENQDRSAWLHWMLPWLPGRPSGSRIETQFDLDRAEAGGLDAQFFSVWVSADFYDPDQPTPGRAQKRADDIIDSFYEQLRLYPDRVELARNSDDIRRISGEGKLAALLGIEGGHAIGDSLQMLRHFHERGVRYMTLTWSFTHTWADSAGGAGEPEAQRRHSGLSPFGEAVVREMNDLGMLVDVSHASDETFWDALAVTRAPVIASHSSARALVPQPRNLSDPMLRAIAANGGVAMINFMGMVLDPNRSTTEFVMDTFIHGGRPEVSVSDVVDHIEHVIEVAGIEHVGLGSDFDGSPRSFFPLGLRDISDLPAITLELLRRGYSEHEIRMVLGENVMRILAAAQRAGRSGSAAVINDEHR